MATDIVDNKELQALRKSRWETFFSESTLIDPSGETEESEPTEDFHQGRADSNPSQDWYKGEIGFFDFYVLPLAKKLQSCGVFGVSSDECLNYAEANREEWVREGQDLMEQYFSKSITADINQRLLDFNFVQFFSGSRIRLFRDA
eukprot:scaffold757_cov74-Cylindrotheca_fusiformis.AAC.2